MSTEIKDMLESTADRLGWNEASQLENLIDFIQQLANCGMGDFAGHFEEFLKEREEFELLQ